MNKKTSQIIKSACILLLAVSLLGCKGKEEEQSERKSEEQENITTAMYVPFGEDLYIMVDQEYGTPFTITMPEEMYGLDNKKITQDDLEKGNIVKLYGNGIMLESYPGQYPGVTKMEVVEKGKPADADKYQQIIDEIYVEPDPSERPMLDLEYRTDSAIVSMVTTEGGYDWTYENEKGEKETIVADTAHVTQWSDIIDAELEKPTDITLRFSKKPEEIQVLRWSSDLRETKEEESDLPEGEMVEIEEHEENKGEYQIKNAQAGYIYLVKAKWENGTAEYGFLIHKKE